jgi:phenylacetate-CoA ligase
MLSENILLKKFPRNDAFWTSNLAYRSFLRRVPFFLDTQVLMRSQFWPRERLDALAQAQLRSTFHRAAELPFWRERFRKAGLDGQRITRASLAHLPVLSKKDFLAEEESAYADQGLLARSEIDNTSGSTGAPFRYYRGYTEVLSAYAFCERALRTAAGGKRYHLIVLRARNKTGLAFTNYDFFFLRGYNNVRHRADDLIELMQRYPQGILFWGFSSMLLEVARVFREKKAPVPIRAAISAGEMMLDGHRDEIEQALGTKISRHYAASELSRIAFECPQGNLHIHEERLYIEILDEKNIPVPHGGEGKVVITVFDNPVMPFIRYDLGDRGILSNEPCPCGRTLRTIKLQGRKVSIASFENGRTVSLLDLSVVFDKHSDAIRQFRIIRTGEYEFSILAVPGPNFESKKQYFTDCVKRIVHPSVEVTWEVLEFIPEGPGGKAVYFVDEYAKSQTKSGA